MTKPQIIREAFNAFGIIPTHVEDLMKVSGLSARRVGMVMRRLANPKRTKDPIRFTYHKETKTYAKIS